MEFTPKSRLLAAIKGEEVDRVPFAPFLAYYFEHLPERIRNKGPIDYLNGIGADILLRGSGMAYDVVYKETEGSESVSKNTKTHKQTFRGNTFTCVYTYSEAANSWFLTEHPVKTLEDLKFFIDMMDAIEVVPQIERVNEAVCSLGDTGLHLPLVGIMGKTAFQSLLEHWIGTEELAYFCADYPGEINEAVRVMREKSIKTVEYAAGSNAEALLSFEDSSTQNLNLDMYRKYILPEISDWRRILAQAGKPYIQHACGHIRGLLPMMAEQKITAVESISPPPTGNVTMFETARILPPEVAVIGGIEPTQFLNDSIDNLLEYTEQLVHTFKNRGFILSNSDSCPPGVEHEKFVRIAQHLKSMFT